MKSKKKIIIISAVGVAVLTVVMVLTLVCFHSWTDATCDTPMTCKKCGKTKGEALSHEWIAATCKEAKHCSRCGITDGEPLAHSFNEATCELPKTCSVCGATEGEPIGHKWNEANCVSPKTCMVCGLTEGDLGEHKWKSATYNSPKTCSVCGKTNVKTKYAINKLNSFYSETEVFSDDGSIEHIISEREGGNALNIGNLILLEGKLNDEAGHKDYSR